jgi:uncharacterized integral membrane protein (TIGR00698 family)
MVVIDYHRLLNSSRVREPILLAPVLKQMSENLFFLGIILAAAGVLSPPLALGAGIVFAMFLAQPAGFDAGRLSRTLLQASVVCLGFGMNLKEVIQVGTSGFLYTAIGIVFAMLLGWLLARLLNVGKPQGFLISAGTAICGGSAIAALSPVTNATDEEVAVSMGTVFLLNSIALFLFPFMGRMLGMTQPQFGLWAALAIHDTSSVVGAAERFGPAALAIGTTVKLARALWIVPMAVGTAVVKQSNARLQLPWFILFFCMAAALATYAPALHMGYKELATLGRLGLAVTLFLIGTGFSPQAMKKTGVRPLILGVLLWIAVGTISLLAIMKGYVHL